MDDTGRLVITAFVLTGTALGVFAWRVAAVDPSQPQRLIGELRLAQAMAILLAVMWLLARLCNGRTPVADLLDFDRINGVSAGVSARAAPARPS